jgi:cytochrome c-type biogenesis protein CcmH/NrfG
VGRDRLVEVDEDAAQGAQARETEGGERPHQGRTRRRGDERHAVGVIRFPSGLRFLAMLQ